MEIISLLVKTRRGVTVNQTQLVDIDDIAAPLLAVNSGADTQFTLREGKKGPFPNSPTNTAIETYVVDQTLAQIAVLAGTIFTANVTSMKGRPKVGSPLMGFNAKYISGTVKPDAIGGGSIFFYQEDSDPDLVQYIVSQTPAQILAQITSNTVPPSGWLLDGNTNAVERYIGTNDAYDLPVRVNGVETFRFIQDGTIQYPLGAGVGYVLTSDATGIATWQPGTGSVTVELDPVISQINNPPGGPTLGDRYLVGTAPTGAWVGNANSIAEWDGAMWVYTVPVTDNVVYITATLTTKRFNGTAWVAYAGTAILQNGNSLGTNIIIGTNDIFDLRFKTSGIQRMAITAAGDVAIGSVLTTTTRLYVRGVGITSATYAFGVDQGGGLSLFYARNDGQIEIYGNTVISATASVGPQNANSKLSVQAVSGADGTKEYVSEFYKNTANKSGFTMAAKEGTAYFQAYTSNVAQDVNMILGGFSSAFGVQLETLTLFADRTAKFADALYIGVEGLISFSGGSTALHFLSTNASRDIQTTVSGTGKIKLNTAGTTFHVDDDGSVYNLGAGAVVTNTAFGIDALIANTTGDNNAAYGVNALKANTTGPQNVAVGTSSLAANTTGGYNVAIGYNALATNNGDENTAIGRIALLQNTSGTFNIAIGNGTLFTNTTGNNNTGVGKSSFSLNTTGSNGVAIGYNAGSANTTGDFNTYIGVAAGLTATTGTNNVFIGYGTAVGLTTGTQNTFIGSAINAGNVSNNIILSDGAGTIRFQFNAAGLLTITGTTINVAGLPTGNGGLASGDLYVDTAAQILANGDQVVGRKV